MKRIIFLSFILFCTTLFAQEGNGPFSKLQLALYSGSSITSAPQTGLSFMIEGKASLLPRLNAKLAIGYYKLYENDFQQVKTYRSYNFNNAISYQTHSYNIEGYDYAVFPICAGLEYTISEGAVSPYITVEGGNNAYAVTTRCSNNIYGEIGKYITPGDVPAEYKNYVQKDKGQRSYRIAFGMGTRISLWQGVNLELCYMYNINTNIVNNHQILAGISL